MLQKILQIKLLKRRKNGWNWPQQERVENFWLVYPPHNVYFAACGCGVCSAGLAERCPLISPSLPAGHVQAEQGLFSVLCSGGQREVSELHRTAANRA